MEINDETFMAELRKVVAENPDKVYERPEGVIYCRYVHGDTPGCLIGTVLHNLGVPLEDLRRNEGKGASDLLGFFGSVSARVNALADVAQAEQDFGIKWSEALANAENSPLVTNAEA